jgi:flavodoxin/Fe-S-cluster-containing hydrogenase component 2
MKCVVIYFSQFGNTEKIAKRIQAGLKQVAGNCDIVKIQDANPRRLYEYDLIGFGSQCPEDGFEATGPKSEFPMLKGGAVPGNVEAFIKDLWSVGGKHVFVFNTHGIISEHFFPTIVPMLKSKGSTVIGMANWYADAYLPWYTWPYPTAGHPDEIDLKEAENFGREMAGRSQRISAGETGLIPPLPEIPPRMPMPRAAAWQLIPFYFKFHKEKCLFPECHLCMDNCPVNSIDVSLKQPVIANPCQNHCAFCAMICPTGAIEIDGFIKDQTPNYLKLEEEVILPRLAKAEAEGRFRRLVPAEEIKFQTSFSMAHKKHPQWIIGKGPQLG